MCPDPTYRMVGVGEDAIALRQDARVKLPKPTKAHASVLFYLRKKPLTADAKPLCIFSCGEQIQRDEQAGKTALICTLIMLIDEQISGKKI